jgi:hypothetical protein
LQDQSQIIFQTYTVQKKSCRTNPKLSSRPTRFKKNLAGPIPNSLPYLHGSKKPCRTYPKFSSRPTRFKKNLAGPIPNSLPDLQGSKKNLAGPIPNSLPDLQGSKKTLQDQSQILFQTYTVQKKPCRTNPKFTLPDLHGSKKT